MAVGGSGGHFSPEYFDFVLIPQFPEEIKRQIARLYHSDATKPTEELRLHNFIQWHRAWNQQLGIWELQRELMLLQRSLNEVQSKIIDGIAVELPLCN